MTTINTPKTTTMKRSFRKPLLLLAPLIAGGLLATQFLGEDTSQHPNHSSTPPDQNSPKNNVSTQEKTIGSEWVWQKTIAGHKQVSVGDQQQVLPAVVFDPDTIHAHLQAVRIDDNGNVLLDDIALKALDKTLRYTDLELTQDELNTLQQLILNGLPGETGEQVAQIVEDYYALIKAEKEFNSIYRDSTGIGNAEVHYAELRALRELYLGQEVATLLFSEQDKEARYMMKSMQLAQNTSISNQQRESQQQLISDQHHRVHPNINNWETRYAEYLKQKQLIIEAGLLPEQSEEQIAELQHNHFTNNELEAARTHGLLTQEHQQP